MSKKKTLKEQGFKLSDMPRVDIDEALLTDVNPQESFKDDTKVAKALLQCLTENDTEAFIEILDAYLRINRSRVAERAQLSRSTVKLALSKRGNPTLKTIAKIVSESAAGDRRLH